MKRFVLFISVLLSAGSLLAQSTVETVYLKNGGLVKGEIIEQVPGQSLKVKTKDGNIFVYQMDEVERITKEQVTVGNEGHRGLDFNIDLGYNLPTKSGADGCPTAELSLGKRFSRNFYWGLGAGAYIPTGGGDVQIPITTEAKMFFPLGNSKLTPFVSLKGGYIINTADDISVGSGKSKVKVEQSNYALLQLMPGISFPLSGSVDFNLAAGYAHTIKVGGDVDGGGAFVVRAGFGFHKNINGVRRPPIPTRDKGFQLTLEGGKMGFGGDEYDGFLGNIVLSYKVNPNLSFGIGGGIDVVNTEIEEGVKEYLIRYDGQHYNYTESPDVSILATKAFVRGQYRLSDKRFSPFVSCDAGLRFYSYHDDSFNGYGSRGEERSEALGEPQSSALFVSPAVGLSLRTFNNSYLELKAGYSLSSGLDEKHIEDEYTSNNMKFERTLDREKASFSAPYVMLSWTHTFGSRKR